MANPDEAGDVADWLPAISVPFSTARTDTAVLELFAVDVSASYSTIYKPLGPLVKPAPPAVDLRGGTESDVLKSVGAANGLRVGVVTKNIIQRSRQVGQASSVAGYSAIHYIVCIGGDDYSRITIRGGKRIGSVEPRYVCGQLRIRDGPGKIRSRIGRCRGRSVACQIRGDCGGTEVARRVSFHDCSACVRSRCRIRGAGHAGCRMSAHLGDCRRALRSGDITS